MASSQNENDFDSWLKAKLIELNTDDEIFSPYIKGILDSDESIDEKLEGLEGTLAEIIEQDLIKSFCDEILAKWDEFLKMTAKVERCSNHVGIDEQLAKLMEETKLKSPDVTVKLNSEQQKLKEAILANYAEVSDGETSDSEEAATTVSKNVNAESIAKAEREKRDKNKEESSKKKEKDKEDRAKQKSKDDERKDKEKKRTQKGERRR